MKIDEAILYLTHTSKDDFNLEDWQQENRYQAIQVVLKEIERLKEEIKGYKQERERVLSIIEERNTKAIEYLKSYNTNFKNCKFGEAPISLRELGELLEILEGDNNDNT